MAISSINKDAPISHLISCNRNRNTQHATRKSVVLILMDFVRVPSLGDGSLRLLVKNIADLTPNGTDVTHSNLERFARSAGPSEHCGTVGALRGGSI